MLETSRESHSEGQRQLSVHLARSSSEIREAQRLRYRIFAEELGAHLSNTEEGIDEDLFDHVAYTALIDTTGRQRVLYDSQVKAQQVLHDIRLLMHSRA